MPSSLFIEFDEIYPMHNLKIFFGIPAAEARTAIIDQNTK